MCSVQVHSICTKYKFLVSIPRYSDLISLGCWNIVWVILVPLLGSRTTGTSYNPNSDLGLPRIIVEWEFKEEGDFSVVLQVRSMTPQAFSLSTVLCCVQLFVTSWSIACRSPFLMGLPQQEHWSGLPFPPLGDLLDLNLRLLWLLHWQVDSLPLSYTGSQKNLRVDCLRTTEYGCTNLSKDNKELIEKILHRSKNQRTEQINNC